jgi:hypothetical protein
MPRSTRSTSDSSTGSWPTRPRPTRPGGPSPTASPAPPSRGQTSHSVGLPRASSGLPVPSRRTLASAILACARSMLAALRHPACACQQRRSIGTGNPFAVQGWGSGSRIPRIRLNERRAPNARTNTAARRCGRRPGPEARGPPRLQGAGMPLQP